MQVIWKTILKVAEHQEIIVPAQSELLTVREQYDKPCLWFKCDPALPKVTRQIQMVGTGHEHESIGKYIGTFFMHDGDLVFHVFEV
jgi:hypothetical protein